MVKKIEKRICDLLESANVCRRCLLRFFGDNEYTNYLKQNVEKTIKKWLDGRNTLESETEVKELLSGYEDVTCPSPKRILATPCAACLGILQDIDKMVSKIETAISDSQHKFKDFVLQVSLPAVVEMRDKLFFLYLQAELGESFTPSESAITAVKDVCKWVIGSQFGDITNTAFTPYSSFQIFISASYPETVKECLVLFQKCPEAFPNARRKVTEEVLYSNAAILKAIDLLAVDDIKKLYTLPPSPPDKHCIFKDIRCTNSSLYLGGRYNKYSRELSQTPWIVDGERHMDSSVSELITDVVQKHILADKIVFSASGREDVDVKMLGDGRPFVLEIINPRNMHWLPEEMKVIENEINQNTNLIEVKNLQVITKEDTLLLKKGEEEKRKSYSAHCIVKKSLKPEDVEYLESLKDLKLIQKTPIRVLHRRTLSTRERFLHSMKGKILNDHHLMLTLETQAGTYIKEFVHSDFGRTTPNLGTLLGTTADILELDVECIHLDWPPNSS